MPCTIHIQGEQIAVQEDPGTIVSYVQNNTKAAEVTRSSDLFRVTVAVGQIGFIVPQAPVSPRTP